jgi:alkaline phosphatase D
VLWTRLLIDQQDRADSGHDPVDVTVELFADSALKQRVQMAVVTTDARRGHSVHLLVQSLQPSTDYWYRFRQGDALSTVGHTRTAPALQSDVASLRMALTSCQHYEAGLFVAHQEIAQQDLDFVLFVGDYIYESSNAQYTTRKHNTEEPKTLEQYRARYAQYKQDPMLQASHAAHPWVLMWDDHEVVNDYANQTDMKNTPVPEFLARRAGLPGIFRTPTHFVGPRPEKSTTRIHAFTRSICVGAFGRYLDIRQPAVSKPACLP